MLFATRFSHVLLPGFETHRLTGVVWRNEKNTPGHIVARHFQRPDRATNQNGVDHTPIAITAFDKYAGQFSPRKGHIEKDETDVYDL